MYGVGVRLPIGVDYVWKPFELTVEYLEFFLEDSLSQRIFIPGGTDLFIETPDRRLQIHFCHESDIHVLSESPNDLNALLASSPYANFEFRGDVLSAEKLGERWFRNLTRRNCEITLLHQNGIWMGWANGTIRASVDGKSKQEVVEKLGTRLAEVLA